MKPATPDEPQGKVNLAVENIHRIWQATAAHRCAQLVFCDLSTPKDKGFSVYRDMADKLERLGVPEREIAFIQDYDSDPSKLGVCEETVRRLVRRKVLRKLPGLRRVLIPRTELDRYLNNGNHARLS